MVENVTVYMLLSFKKADWEAFGLFLESPLCKAKKIDIRLYKTLQDALNAPKTSKLNKALDKVAIFEAVFPQKPFHAHTLNKTMSALNGHIRFYLACAQIREDEDLMQETLIRFYETQNNSEAAQKMIANKMATLESLPESGDIYIERIRLQKQFLQKIRHSDVKGVTSAKETLERLLDISYLLLKTQFACFELSKGLNPNTSASSIPAYRSLLEQIKPFETHSQLLRLYGHLLHLLLSPDPTEADLQQLMEAISNNTPQTIAKAELEGVVRNFQNILALNARKIPKTNSLLADLYYWAFKSDIWGGHMPLINVVYVLAQDKRWIKLEDILNQYRKKNMPPNNEKELTLAEGIVAFFKEKYSRCLMLLKDVAHFQDERLTLQTHAIRVRAAYELFIANPKDDKKDLDLEQAINSFELFLKRAKDLPPERHKEHIAFLNILMQMILPQSGQSLHSMVEEQKPAMREWLLSHIGRLPQLT